MVKISRMPFRGIIAAMAIFMAAGSIALPAKPSLTRVPETRSGALADPHRRQAPASQSVVSADAEILCQVMGVVLIIWLGLALFLFMIDRRVARLEKKVKNEEC
jgi:CcmD family protein